MIDLTTTLIGFNLVTLLAVVGIGFRVVRSISRMEFMVETMWAEFSRHYRHSSADDHPLGRHDDVEHTS